MANPGIDLGGADGAGQWGKFATTAAPGYRPAVMRAFLPVAFLSTAVLAAAGCKGSQPPATPNGDSRTSPTTALTPEASAPVTVTLVADVDSIGPGQEFTVGVRFSVAAGWGVLWENPGEMGIPSRAAFVAPAGFDVSATRYPGPARLELPNGAIGYGYPAETILSATVISPDTLTGRTVGITAEVTWMACKITCVRGTAKPTLSLEIAQAGAAVRPVLVDAWAQHQLALPRLPSDGDGRKLSWKPGDGVAELRLSYDGATAVEFFPALSTSDHLVGSAVLPIDGAATLVVTLRPDSDGRSRALGVVKVVRGVEYAFHALDEGMPTAAP